MTAPVVRVIQSRDEWNALVLGLHECDLKQGYEWGETRGGLGWVPWRVGVFEGEKSTAGASILIRRLAFPGGAVFYTPGGPLFHDDCSADARASLVTAVRRLAAERGAVFLRVSPRARDDDGPLRNRLLEEGFRQLPDAWTTWGEPRVVMRQDIRPSEAQLKKTMRDRTRRYLDRAVSRGALIISDGSPEAMARFHRVLLKAAARKAFPVRGLAWFEAIRREYVVRGLGRLFLATFGGRDLAGILAVRMGGTATLLYCAIDAESKEAQSLHPGEGIHWEVIKWARSEGCHTLDWGGSGTGFPVNEKDTGFGIFHFKLGFGASLEYLTGSYDLVFRPALYRCFRAAERTLLPWAWRVRARLNGPGQIRRGTGARPEPPPPDEKRWTNARVGSETGEE